MTADQKNLLVAIKTLSHHLWERTNAGPERETAYTLYGLARSLEMLVEYDQEIADGTRSSI